MGLKEGVQVDIIESVPFWPGDTLLLCSDGLTSMISEEEITEIVRERPTEEAARSLIDRAKQEGGTDNITVILARKSGR